MARGLRLRMNDTFEIDPSANVRITNDGFLTAMPRIARTGIQLYSAKELTIGGDEVLRIYRPEAEVFDQASMMTYAHKPVTDDHPSEKMTSLTWKKYARGQLGDEIARDGDFVRVPLVLMDQGLINKVKAGKAELSVGYICDIDLTPGTTPSGEAYDGVQSRINVNHVAIVSKGRGGPQLRIGDAIQKPEPPAAPAAMNRPGYISISAEDRAAREQAISDRAASVSDRWRTPTAVIAPPAGKSSPDASPAAGATASDADAQYDQRRQRLESAYKGA